MPQVVIDVDPVQVLRALSMDPVDVPQPVPGGWDTALFRFRTGENAWHALRVFRSSDEAARALREQVSIRAAAAAGIPVPRIEAIGVWHDLPAVVLSWVPGTNLIDALQKRPWAVRRLGNAFGRMQAAIHRVPAPDELRDPTLGNFGGDIVEWARRLDPDLPARLETAGMSADCLIHSDYHPLNVMTDGAHITAVLDWPSAASADARVDVARTAMLLEIGPLPHGPMRPVVGLIRGVFRRAWMRGYTDVAGPTKDIAPFMVLAGLSWLQDLQWAAGRPGVWDEKLEVEPIRRWTAHWKRKAGIA
jgi:aminoglycoside phosphotransferase (APT) family kinase protein